jgi:hypothetical protein
MYFLLNNVSEALKINIIQQISIYFKTSHFPEVENFNLKKLPTFREVGSILVNIYSVKDNLPFNFVEYLKNSHNNRFLQAKQI